MNFGEALSAIKKGKKARRKGWNGKNQYIELGVNASYQNIFGDTFTANHDTMKNNVIVFVGSSGIQVGWLASQADMLSEDWEIFDYDKRDSLNRTVTKHDTGTLEIDPKCSIELPKNQLQVIDEYLATLKYRVIIEGVDLN